MLNNAHVYVTNANSFMKIADDKTTAYSQQPTSTVDDVTNWHFNYQITK